VVVTHDTRFASRTDARYLLSEGEIVPRETQDRILSAARNLLGRRDDRDLARKTLRGAVLSVAVSMIPLIVTLVVSDGI
jgi:hypothetical protein